MSKKLLKSLLSEIRTLRHQMESVVKTTGATVIRPQKKDQKTYSTENSPTFYRYIRPVDEYTDEISSQEGVTLKITLDYVNRVLRFSYSICNHGRGEPSFSKSEGRKIADGRKMFEIPLWNEPGRLEDIDVTSFIVSAILKERVKIPVGDRKRILDQFERSESNFWFAR